MQRFELEIKGPVWSKLKDIFNKYSGGSQHMIVSRLEDVVRQVLKQETPSQVDYVIKNISRIDKDNNGTIEFQEFGNFLLKRHCGEMALQKMHRCNKLKNGNIRKITKQEFGQLLNSAYEFLNVVVDERVISDIFQNVDKDKDGLITYAEYFGFTDAYLLDTKPAEDKRKPKVEKMEVFGRKSIDAGQPVKEFQSRLRKFLFAELRRIFNTYDKDVNQLLDEEQTRLLLMELFGLNNSQINNIFRNYFRPDVNGRYQSYDQFVSNFLKFASDQGWFNLSKDLSPQGRQNFSQSQFFRLLDDSFRHLNIQRVNKTLFLNYFKLLDKNNDGMVEIHDFTTWITQFLSPARYLGRQFYVKQDDQTLTWGKGMISDLPYRVQYSPARSLQSSMKQIRSSRISGFKIDSKMQPRQKLPRPTRQLTDSQISGVSSKSKRQLLCRFNFSSLDLAKRVRQQMMIILARLDKNHNKQFQQNQIVEALQILMKADKREVLYVIANVFRYDRNEDNIVTYEELANFFLEIHFGEIAIQRLHKEDSYIRGSERMMNIQEFVKTLDYALSFIQIETYQGESETLFREVDLNKDGWISYQQYFQFLIHYFGTQSVAAQLQRRNRRRTITYITTGREQEIPPEERLSRLIRTQIRVMFIEYDRNKNVKFQRDQALQIARQVLDQTDEEAQQMVNSVFKRSESVQYDALINKFLQLHTAETILLRLHKQGFIKNSIDKCIDLKDFMTLVNSAFVRVSVLPTRDDYREVFKRINPINDKISYRQYQHFVSQYFGKCDDRSFNTVFQQPSKLAQFVRKPYPDSSQKIKDRPIYTQMYSNLVSIYQRYDKFSQGIEKSQFQQFLKSAFEGVKKQNIDHIIWSIYRVDKNQDSKINIIEATPFMLRLQAELVLHDYHRHNNILVNKERLSNEDFWKIMQISYPFCQGLSRETLSSVFERLDTDQDGYICDIDFLTWINEISKLCVAQ